LSKTHYSVVRNKGYKRSQVGNIDRHNERKNENYKNSDIDLSLADTNIHFKQAQGSYLQTFDQMIADGVISTKGHKKDGSNTVIAEMIFDVNSEYFENHGGYEYAKVFYEEAYQMAVAEVGGEEFILSAVMHADERNKALSEAMGKDVYHYHLHVVYIPVVQKEVLWTKRCKDSALIGTVKKVINQVSHSKKWRSEVVTDESGKQKLELSYSLLQDRFYNHMVEAGFSGFERGERGSTAEHLDVLDYKIQQDTVRANNLEMELNEKTAQSAQLDNLLQEQGKQSKDYEDKIKKQQAKSATLDKKLKIAKESADAVSDIESMGKKTIFGKIELLVKDWKALCNLAREAIMGRSLIRGVMDKVKMLERDLAKANARLKELNDPRMQGVDENLKYFQAKARSPKRLSDTLAEIMRQPPEQQQRQQPNKTKEHEHTL